MAHGVSADPFVQAPYNSQSYNRYSYVFNNPLSFTDPSGFTTDCNNQNAGIGHAPGGDCVEEVEVTGNKDAYEEQRRQNAIAQWNYEGWNNWASRQNIMADATAGMLYNQALWNGGSTVWNGITIQVDIGKSTSVGIQDKKTSSDGLKDGAASVFVGTGLALRYLGRSVGVYGKKEFVAANKEGHVMDALVVLAIKNPKLVKEGINAAGEYAYENANEYNVSRVIGRVTTGFVLAPLGALATIGDVTYGVEKGHTSIQDFGGHIFYGKE